MRSYVFVTNEGVTYQPNSASPDPDIENCQVIGFAKGRDVTSAFNNLITESDYLLDTNFDEIMALELKDEDYYSKAVCFYLREHR